MMLVCAMNTPVDARVNVKHTANYASAYNQVMAVRQQAAMANGNYATTNSAIDNLPVTVDNEALARSILDNSSENVTMDDLTNCSMIYPNGSFKWGMPDAGLRPTQEEQCIAVVELRDVDSNSVLARTTVAAGDMMKCNIEMFPKIGWMSALENVELPADEAPTLNDVEKVMDKEQKQNAGFKIASAAIVSAIAGNMLAPKEAGDTKLLGTSKRQLIDTAISATAGAGVMAASTYSGKVAGDTIKSTAVNAATGAVIGNMQAGMSGSGDSLDVKRCKIDDNDTNERYCVVGNIMHSTSDNQNIYDHYAQGNRELYLINKNLQLVRCEACDNDKCTDLCDEKETDDCYLINANMGGTVSQNFRKCRNVTNALLKIEIGNGVSVQSIKSTGKDTDWNSNGCYTRNVDGARTFGAYSNTDCADRYGDNIYFIVTKAVKSNGKIEHGYAVFDTLPTKVMGFSYEDWDKTLVKLPHKIYARNSNGTVGGERTTDDNKGIDYEFIPSHLSASDGTLVDFSNAGRAKSTLAGAAAGGALGGFSGYEGAKQEIQERWVTAIREYNDSLDKFYCATGTRYLSGYNSYLEIPAMKKTE